MLSILLLSTGNSLALSPTPSQANSATTTSDPDIPLDELGFMLTPMTSDELIIEADSWLALLKETANEISKVQLEVKQKNLDIKKKGRESRNLNK
jgi:small conductance mechanosensitive channel